MRKINLLKNFFYFVRNIRSKELFRALKKYCKGEILDVGGWDFYLTFKKMNILFKKYTTLEIDKNNIPIINDDQKFEVIIDDGCNMKIKNNSFNTVLNFQVLEHVFEPIKMVHEIARVLKKDGYGIFLIPQTSDLHMIPHHYYNFTKYWIDEVMKNNGLKIVELKPLGGAWSSISSHMFYLFFKCFRSIGFSTKEFKRSTFFYLLLPFMFIYIIINIPICMLFSLGDFTEEPNNHLVVVKKI